MTVHLQKFSVSYEYPVVFTHDVFAAANPDFADTVARKEPARRHRIFVIVERAVAAAWPRLMADLGAYVSRHRHRLELAADPLVVEGGEAAKNSPAAVEALQARLQVARMDRHSLVVIVGGGAVLDMAGYAAATVHRGIRVVRVPTTVLAQNDAGVGVKNGVNAYGAKNFLGTFAPPFAVLNDARFLETLGRRDTIAGMAEAVKVALIRDAAFFAWLTEHAPRLADCELESVAGLIRRCAQLHLDHIATSGDPFELGSARPLDFGHWAAHKLESLSAHRLRHGEAVAIGMALDTTYSSRAGLLPEGDIERILGLLERLGFRLWDECLGLLAPGGRRAVLDGLAEFREHLGGQLTVTLLRRIGQGVEVSEIREELMLRSLDDLRERDRRR